MKEAELYSHRPCGMLRLSAETVRAPKSQKRRTGSEIDDQDLLQEIKNASCMQLGQSVDPQLGLLSLTPQLEYPSLGPANTLDSWIRSSRPGRGALAMDLAALPHHPNVLLQKVAAD